MSMRLQVALLGITLLTTFGCATKGTIERPPAEPDMSGRPYALAMGRHLAGAEQFTVHVRTENDQVLDTGVVVGSTERTICFRRPDRLAVRLVHPKGQRQVWYDGSRLVCLEAARKAYASLPAKGSVESVFASLRRDNHYVRPLAALCDSDPGLSLCAGARRVTCIGKANLRGRPCNVVRIQRDDAVLDLWILDAAQPLLLQAAVRQADDSEREQVSRFDSWNFQARLSDAEFKPRLPAGANPIELYDVTGMP